MLGRCGLRTPTTSAAPVPKVEAPSREWAAQEATSSGGTQSPSDLDGTFNSQGKGGFIQADLGVATGRELNLVNSEMLRQRIRDSTARYHELEEQLALREVTIQRQNVLIQQLGGALASMSSDDQALPSAASGPGGALEGTGRAGASLPALGAPAATPPRATATGSGEMIPQQVIGALDVGVERRLLVESEAPQPGPEAKRRRSGETLEDGPPGGGSCPPTSRSSRPARA